MLGARDLVLRVTVLIAGRTGDAGASLVASTTDYDAPVSSAIIKQPMDGLGLGQLDALELEQWLRCAHFLRLICDGLLTIIAVSTLLQVNLFREVLLF